MKIDNQTRYDTRTLRSIICAVHSAEPRGRLKTWANLTVTIVYARGSHNTGYAFYHGRRARLRLPREGQTVARFAALWRHELWHLYGIPHKDYPPSIMECLPRSVDHVDLFRFGPPREVWTPEPVAAPVRPSKADAQAVKVERLIARRKAWAAKAKRAATALAKIDKSLRYYSREGVEAAGEQLAAGSGKPGRRRAGK